jgi:hypothetical protein
MIGRRIGGVSYDIGEGKRGREALLHSLVQKRFLEMVKSVFKGGLKNRYNVTNCKNE